MKNKRMFIVKYLPATNYKGERFRITDTRHKGRSKIYSWNYDIGYLTDQAEKIFNTLGIKIEGYSEPWTEDTKVYFFTDDFGTMLDI